MTNAFATADTRRVFDDVASVYWPVAVAVFVIVIGVLGLVLVRDRVRDDDRAPSNRASSAALEAGYAIGLVLIAAGLAWVTLEATRETDDTAARSVSAPGAGPRGLTIRAVAAKWNWRFEYPGGVAQAGNGVQEPAVLVVPAGGPVRFRLTTRDVEHAFWIPEARYKFDAVPGRANVFDMQFDAGRDYSGSRCSEFCGQYHEQMRFDVDVRSPEAFRSWLSRRQEAAR